MTIPIERTWALERTYDFLRELIDPKQTPRVPMVIRRRAGSLLKHYPSGFYLKQAQEKAPEIFGKVGEL